jgi:hypothetical protein
MSNEAFTNFLTSKGFGPTLRDWQHASRLYIDGGMKRAPKTGFLYIVELVVYPDVSRAQGPSWTANEMKYVGLLAKKVDLPKFTITNETVNQYNRKTVVPTKIAYNPVSIEFHDDNSDITHNLWVNYYKNYFYDGKQTNPEAFLDTKYETKNVIYGRYDNSFSKNFFHSINIFVLHQKQFTAYTLVNPKITEWQHDSLDQSNGGKIMQNKMSIAYESVLYKSGSLPQNLDAAKEWAAGFYDFETSPLSAGPANELVYEDNRSSSFDQSNDSKIKRIFTPPPSNKSSIFDQHVQGTQRGHAPVDKITQFDQSGNPAIYSTQDLIPRGPGMFDIDTTNHQYGVNRPPTPGFLQQLGSTLVKNYVNQNGMTRQNSVAYNIAGSVMGQLGSGPGKYASPPSTENQLGVFTLPGGVGINIFKGFNTTVDGSIRANPAAILFPPKG